ncbi:uncharacterized protein LOC144126197 [Amblyomma americanum]
MDNSAAAPPKLVSTEQNAANFLVLDLAEGWDKYLKIICDTLTKVIALVLSVREGLPRLATIGVFILTDRVECVFSFQYLKTSIRTLIAALSALMSRDEFAQCDDDSLGSLLSDLAVYVGAQFKDYYKNRPGQSCLLNLACFTTRSECVQERLRAALREHFDCDREPHSITVYHMEAAGLLREPSSNGGPSLGGGCARRLPAEAYAVEAALKGLLLLPARQPEALLCLAATAPASPHDSGEGGSGKAPAWHMPVVPAQKKEKAGHEGAPVAIRCQLGEVLLPSADAPPGRWSSLRCLRPLWLLPRDAACEALVRGDPLLLRPQSGSEAALAALCRRLVARRALLVLQDVQGDRLLALPAASGASLLLRRLAPPEHLLPLPPAAGAEGAADAAELELRVDAALSRLGEPPAWPQPTPGFYEALVGQMHASLVLPVPRGRGRPARR